MSITVTLADQINEEIRLAEEDLRSAVEHAWNAGQLLNEQKTRTAHGEWLPWLEENVNVSARRAQEWMDLASSYTRAPAHSSIEDALKAVRQQRRPPRATASDAGALLQSLSGEQPSAPTAELPAPSSAPAVTGAWTDQQSRKADRVMDQLQAAVEAVEDSRSAKLSSYAVAEGLRTAEVAARQAQALLADLAFTFER